MRVARAIASRVMDDDRHEQTAFRESLPANCPPADAVDVAHNEIYRFLASDPPDDDDFASYAAKGRLNYLHIDACRWAACSFYSNKMKALKAWDTFSVIRENNDYIGSLDIPAGAGKSLGGKKNGHVSFWFFSNFDPVGAVTQVDPVT